MKQRVVPRPEATADDAVRIALECYGVVAVSAKELGSTQDRNFLLTSREGARSVLRIDNPVFDDPTRESQHAAAAAYRAYGIATAAILPGIDGELTQRWRGLAVRRSEFVPGGSFIDRGYLAPVVLREFGRLAADSVRALEALAHPGLARAHMWDLRVAYDQTVQMANDVVDADLGVRVRDAAEAANAVIRPLAGSLRVQAIHGDITDDNVLGVLGEDSRMHPSTVLDFGDLSYGWRVAELAVTAVSMLAHDPRRPLRVLETVEAFHRSAPLTREEAEAVWPLMVLRSALLVASGWGQLGVDRDNEYLRERVDRKRGIFDILTGLDPVEAREQVLARLGFPAATLSLERSEAPALSPLLAGFSGVVRTMDLTTESDLLDAGAWLEPEIEEALVASALRGGAEAVVLPYGAFRLTRAAIDSADPGPTWPTGTEVWAGPGPAIGVRAPIEGEVIAVDGSAIVLGCLDGWRLRISGLLPAAALGARLVPGDLLGTLGESASPRSLAVSLLRADAREPNGAPSPGRAPLIEPDRAPAWSRLSRDPAPLLGLECAQQRDESDDEADRRERIFARAQQRYYERPMQIERGWRQHLIDTTGRCYIDMVNNVAGLGHGHPGVAAAMARQAYKLNTNSRFLYRELAEYSERLLALLPEGSGLDTVLLVNSGSEAVDLALRLVQAATERRTVVSVREAYHGWTVGATAVTVNAKDNRFATENRPDWIHVADIPNAYRGTHRGADAGERYAADLGADLDRLAAEGREVAGFICESVLGNAGGIAMPEGYLAEAYARVRAAGGLCIADEVQVGFGRGGRTFWGFERSGVVPDLITIAKQMGNGFPIGAVITSQRVADALAAQGQFFSSAGGNPLSCRVGMAVLDAMETEGLRANTVAVGERLERGFLDLASRHPLIGALHGDGLYRGIELVRDRETLEPATAEATAIGERLRELGVIMLPTSERSNVLKVKPPLCITEASADFVLAQLDRVLDEGW